MRLVLRAAWLQLQVTFKPPVDLLGQQVIYGQVVVEAVHQMLE